DGLGHLIGHADQAADVVVAEDVTHRRRGRGEVAPRLPELLAALGQRLATGAQAVAVDLDVHRASMFIALSPGPAACGPGSPAWPGRTGSSGAPTPPACRAAHRAAWPGRPRPAAQPWCRRRGPRSGRR